MTTKEILTDIQKQLNDLKYEYGDYCIIVYRVWNPKTFVIKEVYQVYRGFSDFAISLDDCIKSISEEYGIDIDIWKYD
jgi:hypothetical protein